VTARRWRGEGTNTSRWQIVLPHPSIRRILERKPTTLLLSRRASAGTYEIHDALTVRRNKDHCANGRPDRQSNPLVFEIEISAIETKPLADLDLATIRSAGYKTSDELRQEWHGRPLKPTLLIHVCSFRIIEARYLHKQIDRGYTTDPAQAVQDEPQALSAHELNQLATVAAARRANERRDEITQQRMRSLAIRLKEAARRGDLKAAAAIRRDLEQLETEAA